MNGFLRHPMILSIVGLLFGMQSHRDLMGEDAAKLIQPSHQVIFGKDNLVAWCIVPFDASQRSPSERAKMVRELGIKKVAYDWRAEHVPTFEKEIIEYKKNEIEFFAFWSWHDALEPLITKHKIQPQIWVTLSSPSVSQQADRIAQATESLMPLAEKTEALGLKLALYNHGGWGGRPSSLISVCKELRERTESKHIGIVYNFHHAHDDIEEFSSHLPKMVPYLFCLNLNGMVDSQQMREQNQKIVPIGSGKYEKRMMQQVLAKGYRGPIGILDHRMELDARESLQQNLDGLNSLIQSW